MGLEDGTGGSDRLSGIYKWFVLLRESAAGPRSGPSVPLLDPQVRRGGFPVHTLVHLPKIHLLHDLRLESEACGFLDLEVPLQR